MGCGYEYSYMGYGPVRKNRYVKCAAIWSKKHQLLTTFSTFKKEGIWPSAGYKVKKKKKREREKESEREKQKKTGL